MSEEERDVLVSKRKYWTKLMKYNVIIYIFMLILTGSFDLPSIELFIFGILLWCWPVFILKYYNLSLKIYKINRKESLEQRQRQHEASKDLTLDSSTTSVSSAVGTTSQETRKEIGNVLGSLESEIVFKIGIVLMTIYALFILFIDHPYVSCRDSNIEELADCVNLANLLFKGLSFMGAIGLILSLIGIYTKPPV